MARYQVRRQVDGYAVVSEATGLIAVANGHLLRGLDDDDASDLVDLINCVEGEVILDSEDVPDREWPVLATDTRTSAGREADTPSSSFTPR